MNELTPDQEAALVRGRSQGISASNDDLLTFKHLKARGFLEPTGEVHKWRLSPAGRSAADVIDARPNTPPGQSRNQR